MVRQDWGNTAGDIRVPSDHSRDDVYSGRDHQTTISLPVLLDTSEVVEEEIAKHNKSKIGEEPKPTRRFLRNLRLDNFVGMTLASVTAWFIVIACASTLFKNGILEIDSAADAARALEPLVQNFPNSGFIAKLIFSVGIIGLGSWLPVLAGSSSYAISEALGWREGLYRKFHRARGFYIVIILATFVGLGMNFVGLDPIKALVFAAVFNGIAAVPLLFILARIGNNEGIMGEYRNGPISNFFVRVAFGTMALAVSVLFFLILR
jgi:Mn2+/Fe2+ NRAMP family transporter